MSVDTQSHLRTLITVDLSNPKPDYLQITDAVRTAIARGSLQPGDRLPPIRETAVQTRVTRNTVSRAYLELEHQGLVRARQGSGFYVTDDGAERERSIRQDDLGIVAPAQRVLRPPRSRRLPPGRSPRAVLTA